MTLVKRSNPPGSSSDADNYTASPMTSVIAEAKTNYRILVVDDYVISAQMTGWMMEMACGHEARLAHDGETAIAMAKDFLPDLVLLDITMPGMTGYEVCRAFRLDPILKDMMIVAQTGWGQKEHRERTREAGFDAHLVKPVSIADLQEVLESLKLKQAEILDPV